MMPDCAKGQEIFKDYIMGVSDGVPKTPDWAGEICGVPAVDIIKLADMYATTKPAALKASCWRRRIGVPLRRKVAGVLGIYKRNLYRILKSQPWRSRARPRQETRPSDLPSDQ